MSWKLKRLTTTETLYKDIVRPDDMDNNLPAVSLFGKGVKQLALGSFHSCVIPVRVMVGGSVACVRCDTHQMNRWY